MPYKYGLENPHWKRLEGRGTPCMWLLGGGDLNLEKGRKGSQLKPNRRETPLARDRDWKAEPVTFWQPDLKQKGQCGRKRKRDLCLTTTRKEDRTCLFIITLVMPVLKPCPPSAFVREREKLTSLPFPLPFPLGLEEERRRDLLVEDLEERREETVGREDSVPVPDFCGGEERRWRRTCLVHPQFFPACVYYQHSSQVKEEEKKRRRPHWEQKNLIWDSTICETSKTKTNRT